MLIRRRAARMAEAVVAIVLIAACTDSSGGAGRQAAGSGPTGGTTRPATSAPPTPSSSPSSSAASPTPSSSAAASETPPSSPRSPSTLIPPVASKIPTGNNILGPTGWQTLQLGMAPGPAEATGIFSSTPAPAGGGCASWLAVGAAAIDVATISPNLGVMAITVYSPDKVLMTPEGMALGWTADQIRAAYPSFPVNGENQPNGAPTIPVPQNSKAVYRIRLSAGVLVSITLESYPQDCYD